MGRATQGVRLIKLNEEDKISSVEKIQRMEGEDADELADNLKTDI
jgi:DNA gyrase subunit A